MLREQAIALFREAVAASDPEGAVTSALEGRLDEITAAQRVILIAFGKAACPMTRAALPFVRDKLHYACAVTNLENVRDLEDVHVIVGGHPLPNEGSIAGAHAVEAAARAAKPADLVLVLISGGGSALICAPAPGLSLADKIALNDALIRCGAEINQINAVRQQFSRLKGGRLAQLAASARMLSLILSDVPGDDISTIASGPTAQPSATSEEVLAIIERYELRNRLFGTLSSQVNHVVRNEAKRFDHVENVIIGSNSISVQRLIQIASASYPVVLKAGGWMRGDVSEVAETIHRIAINASNQKGPVAVVAGGEATVRVAGNGIGGRNQELVLRFALLNESRPLKRSWAFLSGGTDGRDGPTDAAGGIVDPNSTKRMREFGCNPITLLGNNDSYRALESSGDLLITGATGTNVADLHILLMR